MSYLSRFVSRECSYIFCFLFFFFQAEDGIRDWSVTGVQTCALPIWCKPGGSRAAWAPSAVEDPGDGDLEAFGEEVGGVAPRVRSDGRIGGWRRERLEAQPGGDDPEAQHVKAVGHEEDAAIVFPREPLGDSGERGRRARRCRQLDHRAVRESGLTEVAASDRGCAYGD